MHGLKGERCALQPRREGWRVSRISGGPKSKSWLPGLTYGLILAFWSFDAAGAGHWNICNSRFSFVATRSFGILVAPNWSADILGIRRFFTWPRRTDFLQDHLSRVGRRALYWHSCFTHTETFGDWEYCQRTWSVEARTIAGGFATYAIGQIAMLILFATRAQIEAGAV